jgi:hypothetical protein
MPVLLLVVPGALLALAALLVMTAVVEQRVLCPRSMILSTARAKHASPEYAEAFVAKEVERLLRDVQTR